MDINQVAVGDIIFIAPVTGTTTTAWSRAERTENIGKVNAGECYKVGKVNIDKGMVELDVYQTPWPDSLHPLAWGGVWVDVRFVSKNDPAPEPEPQPAPVGDGKTWQGALLAACKAITLYLEG